MSHPSFASGVRVLDATISFTRRPFLRPLRLSSGTISDITEARAEVTVEVAGKRATGRGAIYLSDLWSWPDPSRSSAERDAAMRAFTEVMAAALPSVTGDDSPHVLEAGLRLHRAALDAAGDLPPLARLVSASPLDAALHDATGRALSVSAFALYDEDAPIPSADAYFPEGGAVKAVRGLAPTPCPSPRVPARGWWRGESESAGSFRVFHPSPAAGEGQGVGALNAILVVGKGDDLTELSPWITERGYRVFKLKVGGSDPNEDAARVAAVYAWARGLGVAAPTLTVDANCAAPDAATIGRFLETLARTTPDAFAALESIEQPTGRTIQTNAFDWHNIAAQRPVLLDEGLTDWDDLIVAHAQGWNGMAVKTCRGHSFSLVAAAWAHQHGWTLTMMDLTNPGYPAIHSALFAAHLPGVNAIEMNAAQYTPAANAEWLPRLAPLLEPRDGTHHLPVPTPVGLGTDL